MLTAVKHTIFPDSGVNRYQAFFIHLTVSALVLTAVLGLMLSFWYPGPFFNAESGWYVLQILVGVDLVLGPTLTLIVFKPGKPGLKFDLSLIAAAQLCALAYGAYVIYTERPVFLVYAVDRFHLISADDIDINQLRFEDLKHLSNTGPVRVVAKLPDNAGERQKLLFDSLRTGIDIERLPKYYRPYTGPADFQLEKSLVIEDYLVDERISSELDGIIDGHTRDDFVYYPLIGREKNMILVMDQQGHIEGALDIDPLRRKQSMVSRHDKAADSTEN